MHRILSKGTLPHFGLHGLGSGRVLICSYLSLLANAFSPATQPGAGLLGPSKMLSGTRFNLFASPVSCSFSCLLNLSIRLHKIDGAAGKKRKAQAVQGSAQIILG